MPCLVLRPYSGRSFFRRGQGYDLGELLADDREGHRLTVEC